MENKPTVATGYSAATAPTGPGRQSLHRHEAGRPPRRFRDRRGPCSSLIIPQAELAADRPLHVGTMDVDLGLAIAILDSRYHVLCERLRNAGFRPDANQAGRPTNQRWRIESEGRTVTVDFLIPATLERTCARTLRNLEDGFAAIITPGLELAFQDRRLVTLAGETLHHEQASREVWTCEAGAFTVLKALAFEGRGENKDAYDLIYTLQNYGGGVVDVFRRLQPLLNSPHAKRALAILERDFAGVDSVGPLRVAQFLGNPQDDAIRADAAGTVRTLLGLYRTSP